MDNSPTIPAAEIQRAHIDEVRRRIAEVESGEVQLVPGDEALAKMRNVLTRQSVTQNNEIESS